MALQRHHPADARGGSESNIRMRKKEPFEMTHETPGTFADVRLRPRM